MFRQRVLLTFSVKGDIRFISHHDMMRVLERAVRRAGLPVASSQGFNPRPRIAILQARGVGVSSEAECVEIDFDDWLGPEAVRQCLNSQLPTGLEVLRVALTNPRKHARVTRMTYRVDFIGGIPFGPEDVRRLLDGPEILVERQRKGKTKNVDLRPVVGQVRLTDGSLVVEFAVADQGSARPEEILQVLGMTSEDIRSQCTITRTDMTLEDSP